MGALEYTNRFDSLAKPNKTNGSSRHLLDANCDYVDGAFRLSCLPPKLPILFTVRFTAPADFTPGDVFTLKGQEYTVRTRGMEEPEGKLFGAGAVVQCDFDMEREIAFFAAGGGETTQSCGCQYQTGDLNFFIDPDGDDSPTNPGAADSPFKTFAGARNAVNQRYTMTTLGRLIYNINPGMYELDADNANAVCLATHPYEIMFQASNPNNKPLLVTDTFSMARGTRRTYNNLRLAGTATGSPVIQSFLSTTVVITDSDILSYAPNMSFIQSLIGGVIWLSGTIAIDGCGYGASAVLSDHGGNTAMSYGEGLSMNIVNLPSASNAFAASTSGCIYLPRTTFTGTTSGKRYNIATGGIINTGGGGANYFPGTVAGTTATGGIYS